MEAVDKLLAVDDIRRLKARYLQACDAKDPETLIQCFVPGEVEIAYGHVGTFSSREAFVELFLAAAAHPHILDMHLGGNADIKILSDDSARARWTFDYRNVNTEAFNVTLASGIYIDEYQKVDGQWLISKTAVDYGTAVHFSYEGGRMGEIFADRSVAGVVSYGDSQE